MNKRTTFAAAVAVVSCVLLAGCSDPTPVLNKRLKTEKQSGRINIVSAQIITDARSYNRDILVLRDTETGCEYIAVMGAGVTEMRTQSNGNATHHGNTSNQVEE